MCHDGLVSCVLVFRAKMNICFNQCAGAECRTYSHNCYEHYNLAGFPSPPTGLHFQIILNPQQADRNTSKLKGFPRRHRQSSAFDCIGMSCPQLAPHAAYSPSTSRRCPSYRVVARWCRLGRLGRWRRLACCASRRACTP